MRKEPQASDNQMPMDEPSALKLGLADPLAAQTPAQLAL
jgi:hypothetical protein